MSLSDRDAIHVLHVMTEPTGGGAERLVREMNQKLPDYGIDSKVVYFSRRKATGLWPRESCFEMRSMRSLRLILRLRKAIDESLGSRRSQLLLIHTHLTWPWLYAPIASFGYRSILIHTEHNTHNKRRGFPILRILERWIYRRYARIVCISEGTQRALSSWIRDEDLTRRFCTIPNGAPLLRQRNTLRDPGDGLRLVSVGSLSYKKGFDIAIRAISEVPELVEEYVIVGDGPERGSLQDLTTRLHLDHKVRLVGWQDDTERYLHASDCSLIPSRWEGFGLVAVEAFSTGLPIIAADVPGLREVVQDTDGGHFFEPERPLSLARAIAELAKTLEDGRDYTTASRMRAEQFTLDTMISRYASMYRSLLGQTRSTT